MFRTGEHASRTRWPVAFGYSSAAGQLVTAMTGFAGQAVVSDGGADVTAKLGRT